MTTDPAVYLVAGFIVWLILALEHHQMNHSDRKRRR
jgi:hypothetical protein